MKIKKPKLIIGIIFFLLCLELLAQNSFIENKGQFHKNVISKVNLPSGALFIEKTKMTYAFYDKEKLIERHDKGSVEKINAYSYAVSFLGANQKSISKLNIPSDFYENYFLSGNNYASYVLSYQNHVQKDIYQGIDVLFYTNQDKLKYDFYIKPNADPQQIKIKYEGVQSIEIIEGALHYETTLNKIKEHRPVAYQIIADKKIDIPCFYKLKNKVITFDFPQGYNRNYELVIDPILEFSTYSGSTADNFGYTATYDSYGFLYSGSTVFNIGYPTTIGAYDITYANTSGGTDIAITKYDTTGTQRIYSTYLGGEGDELPHSMIVNNNNELFVFGTTGSSDFPVTPSSYQTTFKGGPPFSPIGIGVSFPQGSDIFVSRISMNGTSLLSSTFLGGTQNDGINNSLKLKFNYADEVRGEIDIDNQNNIYVATCTESTDFPIINGFQQNSNGEQEGCIIKMDNQLSSIIWSSYLGGARDDAIYSLAIDEEDNIYVTGGTNSNNFPVSSNAYLNNYQDSINSDAFITQIKSNGLQILNSSYFGTSYYDQSYFVEIGNKGQVYLFGQTKSIGTQLVNNANYFQSDGGQFIAVFSADLASLIRSTVVGTGKGTPDISPTAFLVDVCDKIYIAGWGSNLGGPLSTLNLPTTNNPLAHQQTTDGNDFYLMVIDDQLSNILYATYFGGPQSNEHVDGGTSRFDKKGIIYQSVCAGCGGNTDFPIEPNPGAVSTTNNSTNCNNAVFKFNFNFPLAIADFNTSLIGCSKTLNFDNLSTSPSQTPIYNWSFGDGQTSSLKNPTHTYSLAGQYVVTLVVNDPGSCNISDTISKTIYILSNSSDTLDDIEKCVDEYKQIGLLPVNNNLINYFWFPSSGLSAIDICNPICDIQSTTNYQLIVTDGSCTDTLFQTIKVIDFELETTQDTTYCNDPILISATSVLPQNNILWSSSIAFTDTLSEINELIVSNPGTYFIKIENQECFQIDSVTIVSENLNILMYGNDTCKGEDVNVGVVNLETSTPIVHYNWKGFSVDSSVIVDSPDSSRWYAVEVINIDSCVLEDSVFITIYPQSNIDSSYLYNEVIYEGEEIILNVETSDQIIWNDFENNNNNQRDFPTEDYCYYFEVVNDFECTVKDSLCVVVLDVFCDEDSIKIPTAFTPNGDNINDTYFITDHTNIVVDFKLEIFNRLGEKVFSSNNINTKWKGTYKNKKLNPQVFDFYLELKCIGEKQLFKKGNISLIR